MPLVTPHELSVAKASTGGRYRVGAFRFPPNVRALRWLGFSKIEIRLHFEEGQILVGKGGEAVAVRDGLLRGEKPVVGLIQQNGGQTVGGVFYGNLSDTGLDALPGSRVGD